MADAPEKRAVVKDRSKSEAGSQKLEVVVQVRGARRARLAARVVVAALLLLIVVGTAQADTGQEAASWLRARGLSPELVVVLIAALPIVELRGAVPVGILFFCMPWWQAVLWALVGNVAPILLVLLLLEKIVAWLSHISLFRRFFAWLFARARSKSASIEKYEFWGLATFVGIPLPGTGAWTGAVAAEVLGLSYWKSLSAIVVGVLMAATVVTFLSVLGKQYRWVGIGLIVLITLGFIYAVVAAVRKPRKKS
ncbi:small multi-drug export protein [candidate division WOR-3 bacterium]|uniref:Small multi-drug export protein n=1 Tax=candidate division WOR-3 bacterium TaxID=2052148 RepID=A0A937XCG3_UNCW3|nr:small multi-drug export protein [candidate division WOR-3 bacterium]